MIDKAGQPIATREFEEAITVLRKYLVIGVTTLPPELAVQLPNILRCLIQGATLTEKKWIPAANAPVATDPPTEYLTWNGRSATVCRYEPHGDGYGPWLDTRELMTVDVVSYMGIPSQ